LWWAGQDLRAPSQQTGNYRLVFDRVGGVSNTPVEFHAKNLPVDGQANENVYSAYATDTWQPAKRLTLNLGARFERIQTWVPALFKEQGPFGASGSFPRVDTGAWKSFAPRAGLSYDVLGDGKTVVKGSYGRYFFDPGPGYAQEWNQNTVTTYSYRWRDLNGDKAYQPGEVNLDLNGPDFITVAGATNTIVNPDLKQANAHQVSTSLERDLGGRLSLRVLYVLNYLTDQNQAINVLRPYSVYTLRRTRRDPGPDGVLGDADDAGPFTVYDYDPAYSGSRFVGNQRVSSDRNDSYNNIEVTLNRRKSGRWFAFTSFIATKNHRWLTLVPDNPNDDNFPLDETWENSFRLAAGYEMPLGINLSTLYEAFSGLPGQRTYLFRQVDPDGGPALRQTYTVRVEPYGQRHGPARNIVNLRGSKNFILGGSRRLSADVDLLNLFNTNVPWGSSTGGGTAGATSAGVNYASGATFGYVTRIVSPRYLRFGVTFEF
jgi:outer membrane receptor protein involved in Fe transport